MMFSADDKFPGTFFYKSGSDAGCWQVTRRVYPGMQHSTCAEELDEVEAFLKTVIPPEEEHLPTV